MIPSLKIPLYGELDSIILHCMVCGELVFDNRYTMDELQERFDAVRPYKEWPCPHLQFVFAHISKTLFLGTMHVTAGQTPDGV